MTPTLLETIDYTHVDSWYMPNQLWLATGHDYNKRCVTLWHCHLH
jgi:hypothetical protein